jgi:SPP1 gp7 family putative phage head morphogenesis protein
MLKVKPSYYEPVADTILEFLYRQYYAPILEIIDKPAVKLNASGNLSTAHIRADIISGKIQYIGGVFSGQFDMRTSNELAHFATFDKRTKKWHGRPPSDILASAIKAEAKRADITARMNEAIRRAEVKLDEAIRSASFGSDLPLFAMNDDIKQDLHNIGVMPDIDERTAERLRKDYNDSQKMNVKGWAPEQVKRLRDMVEQYQTTGTDESLRDMIQREYEVSANKAQFLARQETSLFFSKLSMNRAATTGVRRYRWSTSHDELVRHDPRGPNHKHLDGQVFDIDGEGGVVDLKTGRRAHAGEDFGCRCGKIWVLE